MSASDPIYLVVSADERFERPLTVMLESLRTTNESDEVEIFILTDDMSMPARRRIEDLGNVHWIEPPLSMAEGIVLPAYVKQPALWRLAIGQLLEPVSKVIYLDADTMVRKRLRPLWDSLVVDFPLAAIRDSIVPWVGAPLGPPFRSMNLAPDTPYFNSGVLLINLELWRDQSVGLRALSMLREHRLPHADQCALNAALGGDWLQVDPEWNVQAGHFGDPRSMAWAGGSFAQLDAAVADPAIVHFNTSGRLGRPWTGPCSHPFREEWFEILDKTEWAGWRPPTDENPTSNGMANPPPPELAAARRRIDELERELHELRYAECKASALRRSQIKGAVRNAWRKVFLVFNRQRPE